MSTKSDVEQAVSTRYSKAAEERVEELCCPVDYDRKYLEIIPAEIIEKDYGCGDPSKHLRPGERVLDLGSGTGKICYIASQVVGAEGRVIGIDMNDDMLGLAGSYREEIGTKIGYSNVSFRKGKIQDLALDYAKLDRYLKDNPVIDTESLDRLEVWKIEQRREDPMIPDGSVDVIVSNCVLNLVRPDAKRTLFREMYRVLADGGRAVISDIVSDRAVPRKMQDDPELWSGCISGAFEEEEFLEAFEVAGFRRVRTLSRDSKPWRTVEGIDFRSVTVEAVKGEPSSCC